MAMSKLLILVTWKLVLKGTNLTQIYWTGERPHTLAQIHQDLYRRIPEVARAERRVVGIRATTSIARCSSRGRTIATKLAGIYDWFTESFDTTDLIDANALREAISN
jgi:hypothetical protein